MFTTSWPMQVFLQLIAAGLTRMALCCNHHTLQAQPTNGLTTSVTGFDLRQAALTSGQRLTLHPADAIGRPEHRAATGAFQPSLPYAAVPARNSTWEKSVSV